jgi:CRISPR/Cas system-associated endonuclease/helicase Cas3
MEVWLLEQPLQISSLWIHEPPTDRLIQDQQLSPTCNTWVVPLNLQKKEKNKKNKKRRLLCKIYDISLQRLYPKKYVTWLDWPKTPNTVFRQHPPK